MHGDQSEMPSLSTSAPLSPLVEDSSWVPDAEQAGVRTEERFAAARSAADPVGLRSTIESLKKERAGLDLRRNNVDEKIRTLEGALEIIENLD